MLRHGMVIKWRRLLAVISFLLLCFMLLLWSEDDGEDASNKILKAIHPSTESVVLPNQDTLLVQPWHSKSCQDSGSNQYLLFMIISSPENFHRRQILRQVLHQQLPEWEGKIIQEFPESSQYAPRGTIKALFFVGQPAVNSSNESLEEELYSEAKQNGDMVYDDFHESYLNLTVKTLRMLKWVQGSCPNVAYLVKLDDDVYLNVPPLLDWLFHHQNVADKKNPDENLIAGFKYNKIKIDSDPGSKWYTPASVWDTERFPDFVSGICYVLGRRVRQDLYQGALTTPLFHLEDVFLTGIVREKHLSGVEVEVQDIPGIRVGWFLANKMSTFPCNFLQNSVAVHTLSPGQIECYSRMREYCESPFLSWLPLFLLCY